MHHKTNENHNNICIMVKRPTFYSCKADFSNIMHNGGGAKTACFGQNEQNW